MPRWEGATSGTEDEARVCKLLACLHLDGSSALTEASPAARKRLDEFHDGSLSLAGRCLVRSVAEAILSHVATDEVDGVPSEAIAAFDERLAGTAPACADGAPHPTSLSVPMTLSEREPSALPLAELSAASTGTHTCTGAKGQHRRSSSCSTVSSISECSCQSYLSHASESRDVRTSAADASHDADRGTSAAASQSISFAMGAAARAQPDQQLTRTEASSSACGAGPASHPAAREDARAAPEGVFDRRGASATAREERLRAEIEELLQRSLERLQLDAECLVIGLILLERMLLEPSTHATLTVHTWKLATHATIALAAKTWYDGAVFTKDFLASVDVCSLARLRALETMVLKLLDYQTSVTMSLYAQYCFALRDVYAAPGSPKGDRRGQHRRSGSWSAGDNPPRK